MDSDRFRRRFRQDSDRFRCLNLSESVPISAKIQTWIQTDSEDDSDGFRHDFSIRVAGFLKHRLICKCQLEPCQASGNIIMKTCPHHAIYTVIFFFSCKN